MSHILPINIDDLLRCLGVESARIELKASWDEKTTAYQVLKTICAFANDLQNLNGGYIVIGVNEDKGCAQLPPTGLPPENIEHIQKVISALCKRIDPPYQPIISPEKVEGRHLLVIWAPGSDTRPHKAPDGEKGTNKYWVRIGCETVDAEGKYHVLPQLIALTARTPFDDRRASQARTEDLREVKVREFLHEIHSGLLDVVDTRDLYRKMKIAEQVNGHDVPKNIGLLLFSEDPGTWFPGARIEIVQFAADSSGNVIEEKIFRGGLHEQIRASLTYLEQLTVRHLEKQQKAYRVKGWVSYPIQALREAVVNAVYHRGYENDVNEPVKVYLYSDRMEIISYPGPVSGITLEHLQQKKTMPPLPARNRRIGEFLKELRLAEGRGTGLPKVFRALQENGSPEPQFDFDENRTYFRVTLPAHPEYLAVSALRDAAHLKALGDTAGAMRRLKEAWQAIPGSATLSAELIRLHGEAGELAAAEEIYRIFIAHSPPMFIPYVTNVYIDLLTAVGKAEQATKLLNAHPSLLMANDALDAAILARRLGMQEDAHRYFDRAGDVILADPRALHEFAQTKMELAQKVSRGKGSFSQETAQKLLLEAKELLERVLQLEADYIRHAWAWRDLGRVKQRLRAPHSEVRAAYENAIQFMPNEQVFRDELARLPQS